MPNRHAINVWFRHRADMKFNRYGSLSRGFRVNARNAGLVGENINKGGNVC